MPKPTIYHVGLRVDGNTAVFEYRRCIDFLSCEILKYFGTRETTKTAVKERLKTNRAAVLACLRRDYPERNFTRIVID